MKKFLQLLVHGCERQEAELLSVMHQCEQQGRPDITNRVFITLETVRAIKGILEFALEQ